MRLPCERDTKPMLSREVANFTGRPPSLPYPQALTEFATALQRGGRSEMCISYTSRGEVSSEDCDLQLR
jgi:hypothetical protein